MDSFNIRTGGSGMQGSAELGTRILKSSYSDVPRCNQCVSNWI